MNEIAQLYAVTAEPDEAPALLLATEHRYVTETATGLVFRENTPIEVWAPLVTRLQRQLKLVEWALADALNFGERYGEDYAQWVDETGLKKRTLTNIARIGRAIEPARRRAGVSFSHHAEVVSLPVHEQESLLEAAEASGMTRYDLRDAVRERKRQLEGTVVPPEPEPVALPTSTDDLVPEAKQAMLFRRGHLSSRHHAGFERGWLECILWLEARDCIVDGRWPE